MATVLSTTRWTQLKQTGITTFTVPLTRPAAAGSKLVLLGFGGAIITARITNSSGTLFTKRTEALGSQAVSIQDFTPTGGETQIHVSLNGPENVAVYVYEVSGLGAFISASNNGGGAIPDSAGDFHSKPSPIHVSGNAVLFAGWEMDFSNPFTGVNQWRQMGPLGKLWDNFPVQPGAGLGANFIAATGLADITATGRYPENANAGDYQATSVWLNNPFTSYVAQAAYADASGVPTNPVPANAIAAENSLPGTVRDNWFLGSDGTNPTIAGYTDKASYQPGESVNFKVDSTGNPFRVEIYRLGYYGFEAVGARNVLGQRAYLPGTVVAQPAPVVNSVLGSTSCNWTTNATWQLPANALPGFYYVAFRRTDATSNFASGHFIVRSASVANKVAFCVPDMTYQAYNCWGATTDNGGQTGTWTGRSLYSKGVGVNYPNRSYAVSFDRPYSVQSAQTNTYVFDSEYSLIHFMEAQGYDMTYLSNLDLDGDVDLLKTVKLIVLAGHQEYWTTNVYDCIKGAVESGVNMLSASSNTALWHVRFDPSDSFRRTVICYKGSATADISPGWTGSGFDPLTYTGTWRDTRKNPGGVNNLDIRRENSLTGQMFTINAPVNIAVQVPFVSKSLPIWRNSSAIQALTSGQAYTAQFGKFGDEVDIPDGSAGQPTNMVLLSPTPASWTAGANAAGTLFNTAGSGNLSFTLYRHSSGALVFNTGSWRGWQGVSRWARSTYGNTVTSVDANWQNALLAILYDLGAQPVAIRPLQPGVDPNLVNPATNAPTGTRDDIAIAYGLSLDVGGPPPSGGNRGGDFFLFFV